jgi:hypothetical protein
MQLCQLGRNRLAEEQLLAHAQPPKSVPHTR